MMQVFMRKALADGPITDHIESDNYRQFSETYFSYSTDDVLGLRHELQTVALQPMTRKSMALQSKRGATAQILFQQS